MTLFKQIQLLITFILIVMLIAVLKINFDNTKEFIRNQLYTNSKNTANSMSLSLSPFVDDMGMMTTMINAMYDGGYFEEITLLDNEGKILYQAKQIPKIQDVPEMFIKLVNLQTPVGEAKISSGWTIFGSLHVKGHPGLSYIQLWDSFRSLCISFVVIGAIGIALSYVILKFLLSSLERIRLQAEAIGENEFIINDRIPRTPELRQVVLAMNQMTGKVQSIYNREIETLKNYQELLYKDQLTGLFNRKYFVNKITEYIESESQYSNGEIVFISFEGLDAAFTEMGHQVIKPYYDSIAELFAGKFGRQGVVTSCFNKQEFALILPSVTQEEAENSLSTFMAAADELMTGVKASLPVITKAGMATYHYNETMARVLSKTDYALSVAKSSETSHYNHFNDDSTQMVLGKMEWKTMIEEALSSDRFVLTSQSVKSSTGELHQEIFVNMLDKEGNILRAGYFMPMVVNLNLANSLDKYVLEKSTEYLSEHAEGTLAINITDIFLNDRMSFTWFRQLLLNSKHLKDRMTFEISDNAINSNLDVCLDFSGLIKGLGFTFGVDRFSMSQTSLENLQKLKPNYIKIDYDYLMGKDDTAHTAINSLMTITESLGIKLIATKVENDELKNALENQNIKYFQGRGIADISPLVK